MSRFNLTLVRASLISGSLEFYTSRNLSCDKFVQVLSRGVAQLGSAPALGAQNGGLLKAVIGAAIPFLYAVFSRLPLCFSLLRSASIQPYLCIPLTP